MEAAIALCALVVVLAMALGGVLAVTAQLRCTDAAREAVRLAARGEADRGREAAAELAPRGAAVELTVSGDEVRARVSVTPAGGLLPGLRIGAEALGVLEPGGDAAGGTPGGAVLGGSR